MENINIILKLFATFQKRFPQYAGGTTTLTIKGSATVADVTHKLGLTDDEIGMVMINGLTNGLAGSLSDGDRLALFPPEVAFNTYVSLYFRKDRIDKNPNSKD